MLEASYCNTRSLIGIFSLLLIALGLLLTTTDILVIFNGESGSGLVSQSLSSAQHCSEYKQQVIQLKAQIYDLQQQLGSTSCRQQDDSPAVPTLSTRSSTTRHQLPMTSHKQLQLSSKPLTTTHRRVSPTTSSSSSSPPTTQLAAAATTPTKSWEQREAIFLDMLCGASRPATCAGGGGGKLRFVTCTGLGGLSDQRLCLARSFQIAWMLNLTMIVPPVRVKSIYNPTFAK
jgi:hypothetical protein